MPTYLLTFLALALTALPDTAASVPAPTPAGQHVIVLHGLARTDRSMAPVERRLREAGYTVHNVDYPSTNHRVEHLADVVLADTVDAVRALDPDLIHFVTHSMGGLLVRRYLDRHDVPEMGRVVMLSPPNQGSEVVDALSDLFLYEWIYGPAGQQLGTDEDDLPNRLGPVDFELGVITGRHTMDPFGSSLIPGPDDGRVSVDRARVEGMDDFLVVPATHTFIMHDDTVLDQTVYFLQHGHFQRS